MTTTLTDKQKIAAVEDWPMWPVLPVKKPATEPGTFPDLGVVTADYPETVIHVNLFGVDRAKLVLVQLENDGEVPGVKTTRYADVDTMLADGWAVD